MDLAATLESLTKIVNQVDDLVWGIPLIGSILATGIVLSLMLRFRHLRFIRGLIHLWL